MSAIRVVKQQFPASANTETSSSAFFAPSPEAERRQAPIRLLGLPDRLDEALLPGGIALALPNEEPDAVILTRANAAALLVRRLGRGAAAILPVVDATGAGSATRDRRRADIAIESVSRTTIEVAAAMLRPVVQRLRALPRETIETNDPRLMLLARLFVRDRAMTPRNEVNARETFAYDDEAVIPGAAALAEDLTGLGLMERKFVDKVTICPRCASARMTVRENCSHCGGANIVEEPIVHHFKCACQGPERDFRRGSELVCPKCRQHLKNFSVDYDRPGSIGVCLACGHLSTEHKVGFLCLDCDARVGARDVGGRSIFAYQLTSAGRACAASGAPLPESANASISAKIRAFARRHAMLGQPSCILFARLHRPPEIREHGDAWRQTCVFFGHMMRECFTPETEILESPPIFLALLGLDHKQEVNEHLPEIRVRLERHLALTPKLDLAVFAPEEIPGLAEQAGKAA